MAIDTIKIKSPGLTPAIVQKVESLYRSKRKLSMSLDCGEIEHEFTAASLKGSYDSHISMKVEYAGLNSDGTGPSKVLFEPFLLVQSSAGGSFAPIASLIKSTSHLTDASKSSEPPYTLCPAITL